jgi:hypothetical protein
MRTNLQNHVNLIIVMLILSAAAPAMAAVDLLLTPTTQTKAITQTVEVTLSAQWDGTPGQQFSAVDAILVWDPTKLQFLNADASTAGYSWLIADFLPDPDGINTSTSDGEALYTVLALPGSPATAPAAPGQLIITKFRFKALTGTPGTVVFLKPSEGAFGRTRVLGPTAGSEVTGNISSTATVTIVQPCSPTVGDVNGDSVIDFADVPAAVDVYLGLDTTPSHMVAADANCDGLDNGLDIQPLLDYLLLWL